MGFNGILNTDGTQINGSFGLAPNQNNSGNFSVTKQ
jgi:hypothetical protein